MNEERNDRLIEAAGKLATDISPSRDLWPGIAESIAAPKRSRWTPMLAQAAAVVLLVGASSSLTYLLVKSDQPAVEYAPTDLVFEQASFGGRYTLGAEYQEARVDLAAQLDQELERLAPQTRTEVERNLAIIRGAIVDIKKALEEQPENALLQELLVRTYREELLLMQRVGDLTQQVMLRKDM